MPQTDSVDQDPRQAQRTNILHAAKRVFAHKGKAATMADIAQAAGVSQGLAYRYFASKEHIYRALVEHALEQAARATAPSVAEPPASPGQRLADLITRQVDYRRDHLETFQLLDQVLRAEMPLDSLTEQIRQRREHFLGELRDLIVAGQASGEVAGGDPDQLVIAVAMMLEGLVRFGMHHPEEFARLCPDASIVLRMLMPERKAA